MRLAFVVAMSCLSTASLGAQASSTLQVPQGTATIDGRLGDAEWRTATRIEQPAGTVVRLMRDAGHLYVGITSERPGFASVCLAVGDAVHILHASAALGAITYRRSGDTWRSADTAFTYAMRNTALDAAAQSQRAAYLDQHGWVASTVRMSDGRSQEMQIAFSRFPAPFNVGMGRWLLSNGVEPWPAAITTGDHDGCVAQRLVNGYALQDLKFHSINWVPIGR